MIFTTTHYNISRLWNWTIMSVQCMFCERTDRATVHKASWCLKYSVQQTAPSLPPLHPWRSKHILLLEGIFFFQTSRWGVSGERWTTLTVQYSLKFPWGPGTPPTEQTQESWLMLSRETAGINFKGPGPDKSSEIDGGFSGSEEEWGGLPGGGSHGRTILRSNVVISIFLGRQEKYKFILCLFGLLPHL